MTGRDALSVGRNERPGRASGGGGLARSRTCFLALRANSHPKAAMLPRRRIPRRRGPRFALLARALSSLQYLRATGARACLARRIPISLRREAWQLRATEGGANAYPSAFVDPFRHAHTMEHERWKSLSGPLSEKFGDRV